MNVSILKNHKLSIVACVLIVTIIVILLWDAPIEWVLYNLYYRPLYSTFSSTFYLPFYLSVGIVVLLFIAMTTFLYLVFIKWGNKEKQKKTFIISTLVLLIAIAFLSRNAFADIALVCRGEYSITECRLDSLIRRITASSRNRGVHYNLRGENEGCNFWIALDIYQYTELLRLSEIQANRDSVLTVYYLQNTKQVMKYAFK